MIVDSSALVAILRGEADAAPLAAVLGASGRASMSAPTYLETSIVVTSPMRDLLDSLLHESGIDVVAFDGELARVARDAYARFGKGSRSPARLNLGDCFSYALAMTRGEPLLFKGDDFRHTDVTPAL